MFTPEDFIIPAILFVLRILWQLLISATKDWPIVNEAAQREWMRQSKEAWPRKIAPPRFIDLR